MRDKAQDKKASMLKQKYIYRFLMDIAQRCLVVEANRMNKVVGVVSKVDKVVGLMSKVD
jgi:hypothetical protein